MINGGTLQINNISALGSGQVTDNAALRYNLTGGSIAGGIYGSGNVIYSGGMLTLTGPQYISGATVVNAGTLSLGTTSASLGGFALSVNAARDLTLKGNRELIGQAVANLVDNALKYGAAAEPAGRNAVMVDARREGEEIVIEVGDHGPGVAEADRQRVFNRFVRLEGARSRPGSGLGLSLAAAAAHMHGGSVALADNAPGLRVIVRLPREEAPAPRAACW